MNLIQAWVISIDCFTSAINELLYKFIYQVTMADIHFMNVFCKRTRFLFTLEDDEKVKKKCELQD